MMTRLLLSISRIKKEIIIAASLVLTVLIGYIDFITGVELSVSLFYLLPITLGAWFINKWMGLGLSAFGGIVWFLADFFSASHYSHPLIPYWNTFILIASFAAVSLTLSALKKSMDRENDLAVRIQRGLLPKRLPQHSEIDTAVEWIPESFVSGDYYDFVELGDNKLGICIGDVSGHGVSAALLMSNLQAAFRLVALKNRGSDEVCALLNSSLIKNAPSDKFATFVYCIYDFENKTLEYTNAGHPSPLIFQQNGNMIKLESSGTMLGAVEQNYSSNKIVMKSGDVILFYTDGIIETKNLIGEMFGEEKLIHTCMESERGSALMLIKNIKIKIAEFNAEIFDDDITLLAIKLK